MNASEPNQNMNTRGMTVNPVEQFNFENPHEFEKWIVRFERYRALSGLHERSDEDQVNAMVYYMGPKAEEIFLSFNESNKKTYEDLKKKFKDYFIPKVNVIYERVQFHKRTQQEGESVNDFVTDLHTISQRCNYKDLREEFVRDQLVVGILDKQLSERLQLDPDLTLEKALNQARQFEELKRNSAANRHYEVNRLQQKYAYRQGPVGPDYRKGGCTRCGALKYHNKRYCPAQFAVCNNCKKRGHFAKVCNASDVKRTINKVNSPDNDSRDDEDYIGVISGGKESDIWTANLCIEDRQTYTFKLDSGADETVMPATCIQQNKPLYIASKILVGAGGKPLDVVGKQFLTMTYKNKSVVQTVYFINNLRNP